MKIYLEGVRLAEQVMAYWRGELSPTAEAELMEELKNHPKWADLLADFQDHQKIINREELYRRFDTGASWKKVSRATVRTSRRLFFRYCRYAAMLLLPLSGAGWWLGQHYFTAPEAEIVDAVFYDRHTLLELADGKCIPLDSMGEVVEELNLHHIQTTSENGLDYSARTEKRKMEYHRIVVPRGAEYSVRLADGTKVWLFAETEIRFPTSFQGPRREVFLTGEAYFEVVHDPAHPFYVKTKELEVKVLGTSFNVMAYEDAGVVETSLVEGKVGIKDQILLPNTQLTYNKKTHEINYRTVNANIYRLRKERMFVFEDKTLRDILEEMARWYDFEVFYQHAEMADKKFGFKLEKYEQVDSLLKILELTGEVKFEKKGRSLIVKRGN